MTHSDSAFRIPHSALGLDRERILAALQTRAVGRELHVHAEVTSTNDVALALGAAGAPHGAAVVADRQTQGRGRLGRTWESPPGAGLWVSVVLRPRVPAAFLPLLTLAAGLATAEAIEGEAGVPAALKWPNDVILGGRKVAGILAEAKTADLAVEYVVVGIGINVHQDRAAFPPELAETAVSIRQVAGQPVSRDRLLVRLFGRLEAWGDRLVAEGAGPVVASAAARMPMLGRPVVAVSGAERWEGTAARLDGDGALVLALPGGRTQRVLAGDVTLATPS